MSVPILPEARAWGCGRSDERERDKDVWLDPLTRGSELHDRLCGAAAPHAATTNRRPEQERRCLADGARTGNASPR